MILKQIKGRPTVVLKVEKKKEQKLAGFVGVQATAKLRRLRQQKSSPVGQVFPYFER